MRDLEYWRTTTLPTTVQAAFTVLCGLALSWLAINVPMLVLLVAFVATAYCIVFLKRADLGLLSILAVRPSMDISMSMGFHMPIGPVASLTPNALLVLPLVGCGAFYMFGRGVPFLSLPGGVILILFQLVGLAAMLRAESVLSSLNEWLAVASTVIVYALAAHLFRTPQRIQRVIDVLAVSFVTPAIFGLQQLARGMYGFGVRGTFVDAPGFSQYLVLIVVVFTGQFLVHSGMRKFLAMVIVATSGVLLIATGTRGSWTGTLAALFVIAILRKRVLMVLLMIAMTFAVPMIPSVNARIANAYNPTSSLADRLNLWQLTIQEWKTTTDTGSSFATIVNRFIGLGPKSQPLVTGRTAYGESNVAHDDYLRVAIEYGIFGLALYLVLSLVVTIFAYRTSRRCTDRRLGVVVMSFVALTIGYSIVSLAENIFGTTYVQIPLWTLAGMTVAIAKLQTQFGDPASAGVEM